MARFNSPRVNPRVTTNYEGEVAYKLTPELELYTTVCCSILQPKFYERSVDDQIEKIRKLIPKVDPKFVCQLAIYTREKMYLRSIPLVLCVEAAKAGIRGKLLQKTVTRVIQRADEITEILAYYTLANKENWVERNGQIKKLRKLSKAIERGVAEAFHKFDEYQFAKYNRNKEIRLKDAMFITHPKPRDKKEEELFRKIANDELEPPYTWEVELSKLGQQHFETEGEKNKAFRNKWMELIDSDRLGYMALLRNLRNILEYDLPNEYIEKVCNRLTDPREVRKSKQFPFRFFSAYLELRSLMNNDNDPFKVQMISKALDKAAKESVNNLRGFDKDTRVMIACDVSGSMDHPISSRSKMLYADIGLVLGGLLKYKCELALFSVFATDFEVISDSGTNDVLDYIYSIRQDFLNGKWGWSTNGYKVIQYLNRANVRVDKIMIFTDMQLWNDRYDGHHIQTEWNKYRANVNPEAELYIFDLAGYGTSPVDVVVDKRVWLIAGWSDKVFDTLDAIRRGKTAVEEIKKIEI